MDGWDELFAKAAGGGHDDAHQAESGEALVYDRSERDSKRPSGDENSKPKKKRKQKHRPHRRQWLAEIDLEGRMTVFGPDSPWPFWMTMGTCIQIYDRNSENDSHWQGDASSGPNNLTCAACKYSTYHHAIAFRGHSWPLILFCTIRNMRCASKSMIESNLKRLDCVLNFLHDQCSQLTLAMSGAVRSRLHQDEANLLVEKLGSIVSASKILGASCRKKVIPKVGSFPHDRFESAVRLIVACDAAYYRLYYIQITQQLPNDLSSEGIPHPLQYFGLKNLNYDEQIQAQASAQGSLPDPLSMIHEYRQRETSLVFESSGWIYDKETEWKFAASLLEPVSDENAHETPAPPVLSSWRDSCRDFLCNLYAYATVPPSTLHRISECLRNRNSIPISLIEMGAGTGYVAKLLSTAGVQISAWDLCPTGKDEVLNEYHGSTPPFYKVGNATSDRFPLSNAENSALLLCYPPPKTTMAYDAIQSYLRAKGSMIIHIGEFHGLTGDARFEKILLEKFKCIERHSCLTWGTDCSSVTIWSLDDGKKKSNEIASTFEKLLLPCTTCREREATRRCRLLRTIAYCSKECFDADADPRSKELKKHMIALGGRLDFDKSQHFIRFRSRS